MYDYMTDKDFRRKHNTKIPRYLVTVGVLSVFLFLAGAGAGIGTGTAAAATTVNGCADITSPGTYHLGGDIDDAAQDSCINITTSNVVFDGQGHAVDGDGSGFGTVGINATTTSTTFDNVTVRNVEVTDWNTSVQYINVDNGKLTGINATSSGAGIALLGAGNNITENEAHDNEIGIVIIGATDNRIEKNTVTDSRIGISVREATDGGGPTTGNTVKDNLVMENSEGIEVLNADGNFFRNNTAVSNDRVGIKVRDADSNGVLNNTVNDNNQAGTDGGGILVNNASDTIVINNTVRNNERVGLNTESADGIVAFNNTVTDTVLSGNRLIDGLGIFVNASASAEVSNNTVRNNEVRGVGIRSADGAIIENNTVVGNNLAGILGGGGGIIILETASPDLENNTVRNNERVGVSISSADGIDVRNNRITENCGGNFGLALADTDGAFVVGNNVSNNTGIGMQAGDSESLIVIDSEFNDNGGDAGFVGPSNPTTILGGVTANGNNGTGLNLGKNTEVRSSEVRENSFRGIEVTGGDVLINETTVVENTVDLRTESETTLESVDLGSATLSGTAKEVEINKTTAPAPDPTGERNIGQYFEAKGTTTDGYFDATVEYDDTDVSGVNESTLGLRKFDGSWIELPSTVNVSANTVSSNVTNFSAFGVFGERSGPLFTRPLIDRFGAPPTNIPANDPLGFNDTLYEDLDGDGSGKDVSQTVAVFGELIRGKHLNGGAPDGTLTDEQARALNWNSGSPETEVTPADMVSLFGEQIRADRAG